MCSAQYCSDFSSFPAMSLLDLSDGLRQTCFLTDVGLGRFSTILIWMKGRKEWLLAAWWYTFTHPHTHANKRTETYICAKWKCALVSRLFSDPLDKSALWRHLVPAVDLSQTRTGERLSHAQLLWTFSGGKKKNIRLRINKNENVNEWRLWCLSENRDFNGIGEFLPKTELLQRAWDCGETWKGPFWIKASDYRTFGSCHSYSRRPGPLKWAFG